MEIHRKFSLAIHFLVVLIIITMLQYPCLGQNSQQDYLDAHNAARATVGGPGGVGNMTWDDDVAAFAQSYANERMSDCSLTHSGTELYGENIAAGTGVPPLTGAAAVNLWVNESSYYDYASNQCIGGQMCEHYTQVVWRASVRLGCARVECYNGGVFVTCNYDPPGNYNGQRPY
ncbi:pathogenesis-related protein 1c [Phtheirospermum japonicum]|uniref:Pathogenesis-related protein 1c n=1 Tax=Phtheirospermum japonicum TaxID=374723 RepID=A0A830BWH1_9LAMI|nr:pathogenesis-related protein 1c [Phtheirospermum japonicum]